MASLIIVASLSMRAAGADGFDNWTLDFNGPDNLTNHFDSGPTVTARSNIITLAFTNTVFSPGTPIVGFSNTGCVGLCSNFYYTLAMGFGANSPTMNVVAGHDYAIKFNVDTSNFQSTADYYVQPVHAEFEYILNSPVPDATTLISLIPDATTAFSITFIPLATGPIAFKLNLVTGINPNGAASSSVSPFTESGIYQYSDFSITDTSAPPTSITTITIRMIRLPSPAPLPVRDCLV